MLARLLGGSDTVPNCGPDRSPELQGAREAAEAGGTVVFEHGLSARMNCRSFSNTDSVYVNWSCHFSFASDPCSRNSCMVWSMGWNTSRKLLPGLPKAI